MSTITEIQLSIAPSSIPADQAHRLMDEWQWLALHREAGNVVYVDTVVGIGVLFGDTDRKLTFLQMATMRAWQQQTPDWRSRVARALSIGG